MQEHLIEDFENITRPIIKWMSENVHPHNHIIITSSSAEFLESIACHKTEDFLKD